MNWVRSLYILTTIGLLTKGSLFAWNQTAAQEITLPNFKKDYPLSQEQKWYTEESYLLLKPSMGNMWYGNKYKLDQINANNSLTRIKVKDPQYEWSSGARIGIGRYFSSHDGWDASLTTTYLYSNAKNKTAANLNLQEGFSPSYGFNNTAISTSGQFAWKLNYWTVDLAMGRLFQMTSHIVFHPYLGLRNSWQYQHAITEAVQNDPDNGTNGILRANIHNNFWGVGPRFGTYFSYYFASQFSFFANFSTSLLIGQQRLRNNQDVDTVSSDTGLATIHFISSDKIDVIRSNVEGMIGLGWEKWMRNRTLRIAPSISLEGSLWFAMNQLYNIYNTNRSVFDNVQTRRQGNLGLMGISFNFQVDF